MASVTRYYIAEQTLLRLAAGFPEVANRVQLDDVIAAVGNEVATMFQMQQFSVNLPAGETIPDGLSLATYSGRPVTQVGTRSKTTLPVMPISLPRNMGVFQISKNNDFTQEMIPMAPGQYNLLSAQPGISDLLGLIGYEVYGSDVVFHRDITVEGVTAVNMRLVVMDISSYDDYTPLPIPADMVGKVVDNLYKKFAPVEATPVSGINDNYNPDAK